MRPIQRARTTVLVTWLGIVVSGCGRNAVVPFTPTAPSPPPPAPTFPVVTVIGQVTDAAGSPIAANVVVYPLRMSQAWYGPWGRGSQTDASGRYRITNVPEHHDTVYVRAWKDGYVQQCAKAVSLVTDASADVTLTAKTDVVITGLPPFPNTRQISGTVYTMNDSERQPVAGVWVGWEPMMDTVVADTVTDALGRYRLCGLPRDRVESLYAVRIGTNRSVYAEAATGGDTIVDFSVP